MKKHNSKLPHTSVCLGDSEPKYGYVKGEWDECGGHWWLYSNPSDPKNTFSQKLHPSGSYETHQHDESDNEINIKLVSGEHRNYVGGGKSTQVDGHFDVNTESTYRAEAAGDYGVASGNKYIRGSKSQAHILESSSSKTTYGSSAVTSINQSGTERKEIEADKFSHIHGNEVKGIENNKIVMVQKDSALYVGQNQDVYVGQKGKIETSDSYEIKAGGDIDINSSGTLTLETTSKIILKVGTSKITIDSSGITIDAGSGSVTTLGTSTKLQGGGLASPPITVQ